MEKEIIECNKKAWNEAFEYHKKARNNCLQEKFAQPEFTTFKNTGKDKLLLEKIKSFNLAGKKLAHIQTNNGRELLSLMRVCDAAVGVGFDISDEAIKEARELAEITKLNAKFECVNILEISEKYNRYFDMIYITEGSLSWLPDVNEYFRTMNRLLKKGGKILISEIHPVGFVLSDGYDRTVNYDDKGPYKLLTSLDYVGGVEYEPKDCYWFMHKTSDIIMALIKNGFEIEEFEESNLDTGWIDPENKFPNAPRSFILVGKKLKNYKNKI